jgi:AAA domain (dynein-related subfamily)
MQVKISQATSIITKYIQARLVPMLVGSPGMGKSAIVHQIAENYNLKVIDLRLSQCDPTDLLGFPTINGDKAGYKPMETFPIEGDAIPEGYSGWLLFLDEFNSAGTAVQAAAYKLILDRMVGPYSLHKNVAVVCAGNLETDNAIVTPMSTAMQSRLVHIELAVDTTEFIDWAANNGIDHRITDYIKFKPQNLYAFVPDHTDKTFACSRTWEFANRVLKVTEDSDPDRLPMLAGTISEGIAREFLTFCKIYQSLPKIVQIIDTPEHTPVPVEPSILFAMTGSLSHNATAGNLEQIMKYIVRLPVEFQIVTLKEIIRRNKSFMSHASIQNWISSSATDLF